MSSFSCAEDHGDVGTLFVSILLVTVDIELLLHKTLCHKMASTADVPLRNYVLAPFLISVEKNISH